MFVSEVPSDISHQYAIEKHGGETMISIHRIIRTTKLAIAHGVKLRCGAVWDRATGGISYKPEQS